MAIVGFVISPDVRRNFMVLVYQNQHKKSEPGCFVENEVRAHLKRRPKRRRVSL